MRILRCIFILLLLSFVFTSFAQGEECKGETYIYYGNGMFTDEYDAYIILLKLEQQFQPNAVSSFPNEKFRYSLAYNHNEQGLHGYNQIIEVSRQRIGNLIGGIWRWMSGVEVAPDWFQEASIEVATLVDYANYVVDSDLQRHVQEYRKVVDEGNRILLVAHSQGNLYGNSAHELLYNGINPLEENSFAMVSVATPANYVAGGGPYTTLTNDRIIQAVRFLFPDTLDGNKTNSHLDPDWKHHSFIGSYLYGDMSGPQILQDMVTVISAIEWPDNGCEFVYINLRLYSQEEPRCIVWNLGTNNYASITDAAGNKIAFPCDPSLISAWLNNNPPKTKSEIAWDYSPFGDGSGLYLGMCRPETGLSCQAGPLCNSYNKYKTPCEDEIFMETPGLIGKEDSKYVYKFAECCQEDGPYQSCNSSPTLYATWHRADYHSEERSRIVLEAFAAQKSSNTNDKKMFGTYRGVYNGYEGDVLNKKLFESESTIEGYNYYTYTCGNSGFDVTSSRDTVNLTAESYEISTFLGSFGNISFKSRDYFRHDDHTGYSVTDISTQIDDYQRHKIGIVSEKVVLFLFLYQYRLKSIEEEVPNPTYSDREILVQSAADIFQDTASINPFTIGPNGTLTSAIQDLISSYYDANGAQNNELLPFFIDIEIR